MPNLMDRIPIFSDLMFPLAGDQGFGGALQSASTSARNAAFADRIRLSNAPTPDRIRMLNGLPQAPTAGNVPLDRAALAGLMLGGVAAGGGHLAGKGAAMLARPTQFDTEALKLRHGIEELGRNIVRQRGEWQQMTDAMSKGMDTVAKPW